jgi:catechol 2,3-dioxygenase-like lactoylglutathione lyase family enzyme
LIHHVTRVVDRADVQACSAFYGILGFRPVAVPEGIASRAVWLESGAAAGGAGALGASAARPSGASLSESLPAPAGCQQIHLMFGEDTSPEAGHLALICPDYDAMLHELRAAGHEVEPRREHWGAPRAYVRDPAGNLVELMAWAPGAAPATSRLGHG